MRLPSAFTAVPDSLGVCNFPSSDSEIEIANLIRSEYVLPNNPAGFMEDVVRAFRLAEGASVYIEVGTQDKGNIAWVARTKLKPGATIIDIDFAEYPESDRKIMRELKDNYNYHPIRGDCLSDAVLTKIKNILEDRKADIVFCDSHYTYSHTLIEFGLYFELVKTGGFLLFHDAQWPGDPAGEWEETRKKGKGIAIEQLDRFYPAWIVVGRATPLHRPIPLESAKGHWGTLAIFPK